MYRVREGVVARDDAVMVDRSIDIEVDAKGFIVGGYASLNGYIPAVAR